jgi:hypothetical protein
MDVVPASPGATAAKCDQIDCTGAGEVALDPPLGRISDSVAGPKALVRLEIEDPDVTAIDLLRRALALADAR